jgi:hypothetical protein
MYKCYKETLCVAISNKKNVIFFLYKIREQEDGTSLAWGEGRLVQMERGGGGEMVKEGE